MSFPHTIVFTTVLLLSASAAASDAGRTRLQGTVRDQTGAAIPAATVVLQAAGFRAQTQTDAAGRFAFDPPPSPRATLMVSAKGFAGARQEMVSPMTGEVNVVLGVPPVTEEVVVTADRGEVSLGETAATVSVLGRKDLTSTAALTLDEKLRQVPGFTLFRRSGARTANPTSQGVSLRGVGASGASRALVLSDGVPLNDPFGGWVYWDRVPTTAIDSVEVLSGGGSHLYGAGAMSGVVNVLSRRPAVDAFTLESSMGSRSTPQGSAAASKQFGPWSLGASAEGLQTDGYVLVPGSQRGLVDSPATVRYGTGMMRLERRVGATGSAFASGALFNESRENGTPLQTNSTRLAQASAGLDHTSSAGLFALRIFGSGQSFAQTFSSISATRNSETLTRTQQVPAQQAGISAQWSRAFDGSQNISAGFDGAQVRGVSDEIIYAAGVPSTISDSGGRQRTTGLYAQDRIQLARLALTFGARLDHWTDFDAFSLSAPVANPGAATTRTLAERGQSAFSPHLGAVVRLTSNVSLTGSAYRAFRAPTLNELYRAFRVGNVLTLANENLTAEHLTGLEFGARCLAGETRLRANFFWLAVDDPIANTTLRVTSNLITRQRQNLGKTRSAGIELQAERQILHSLSVRAGYQFANATVLSFPPNPALEGRWVPQVPRHQFSVQTRYAPRNWTLAMQARASSRQFEDDQNDLPLDSFFTLDASASRALLHGVEAFVAVENVFNQRYMVGRTPVVTLGPPLLARVGMKLNFGGRK